jgi:aromatic ring-cleaving dioxygenase
MKAMNAEGGHHLDAGFRHHRGLYQWHIRVHQHAEMVQLLYLHKGRAEIEIEGTTCKIDSQCSRSGVGQPRSSP